MEITSLFVIYKYISHPPPRVKPQKTAARPNKEDRGEPALPWYADQALPFDITLACANEYGAAASAKLFGVEILNEGFGTSIDDTVIEQQGTFVARDIAPLQLVSTAAISEGRWISFRDLFLRNELLYY